MERTGFIYRIDNDIDNQFYIGSTGRMLSKRMSDHRADSKKECKKNRAIYKLMNQYGIENFKIYLVEEVKYKSKQELVAREGHYIRTLNPSLNKNVAGRTAEEYEALPERIEAKKQWHENNRERHIEQMKQYRDANKDKIVEYRKQYYIQNKQKLLEQKKKYRESKKLYQDTLKDASSNSQDRNEDIDGFTSDCTEDTTTDSETDL